MSASGQGFQLTAPKVERIFVFDNVRLLEQNRSGASLIEADRIIRLSESEMITGLGPEWLELSEAEQDRRLTRHNLDRLVSYPKTVIAKSAISGLGNLFSGGGATNYHGLLGLKHKSSWDILVEEPTFNFLSAFVESTKRSSPVALGITFIAVAFAVSMRVLGVVGIILMIARRRWSVLVLAVGVTAYFAAFHVFNSSARYRLPIEPILFLLSLYGVETLRRVRGRHMEKRLHGGSPSSGEIAQ